MADLTWSNVLLIGGVATFGFMFLSFWWSGIMARRGWSWQVKAKPKKKAPKTQ